jgi:CubicO group peptidase (beta-lactamase class C family)
MPRGIVPAALFLVLLLLFVPVDAQIGRNEDPLERASRAAAQMPRLHSLIVSSRGKPLLEYFGRGAARNRPTNVKSVSKSVISTLVGIALDKKLIPRIDEPIGTYFPQLRRDPDPRKAAVTIEDLLTMRSGLVSTSFDNYGSWVASRNWIDYILTRPMAATAGEGMEYSTGNTHLLSAILTRATRQTTWAFAQEQLAAPLGFTLSRWARDPQGIFFGGNDMLLTPAQMLTLGELYLNRGRHGTRQIVPAPWVDASCRGRGRSRFNPDQTYGYGWWSRDFAGEQACFAWGYGGQYILVFRELELVVVTTSSTAVSDERRDHRRQIFDLVEQLILPVVKSSRR